MFRENNCQLRILHLAKLSHSNEGKIKTFQTNKEESTVHKTLMEKKGRTTYHQEEGNLTQKGIIYKRSNNTWPAWWCVHRDEDGQWTEGACASWSSAIPSSPSWLPDTEDSCQSLFVILSQVLSPASTVGERAVVNSKELIQHNPIVKSYGPLTRTNFAA